jgi:uncharacterized membrane protein (UPF0182 family)
LRARRTLILWFVLGFAVFYWALRHGSIAYVRLVWYSRLGFATIFWRTVTARLYTGGAAGLFFGLMLYLNLRTVLGTLGAAGTPLAPQPLPPLRTARRLAGGIAAVAGALAGWILAGQWPTVWFALHAVPFRQRDPLFHRNAAFYVFRLPFYHLLDGTVVFTLWFNGLLALGIYLATGLLRSVDGRPVLHPRARTHLASVLAALLALKLVAYRLDAWDLLISQDHGYTFGPGYADVHAVLPMLVVLAVFAALAAATAVAAAAGRSALLPWGIGAFAVASLLLGTAYPAVVEALVVRPDQLVRERPYIVDNIQATRAAFALNRISLTNFPVSADLTAADLNTYRATFRNIRLWDQGIANPAFQELQGLRTYYNIDNLSVDRYMIDGHYRLVLIGAREIDYARLPADTWVNRHLKFTHGYGVVVVPASTVGPQGLPLFWMKNIADTSSVGLRVTQPRIYYGEQTTTYAIVGPRNLEFDYPDGAQDVYTHYRGSGGIPVGNFLQKLAFSIWAGNYNALLSPAVGPGSRALIYRALAQRLPQLLGAPFLTYDSQPYLVIAAGRLDWIIDAYTTSADYPYSTPAPDGINYIRDAVKVVVGAYSGRVHFYVADPHDPIIRAEEAIFPGVFQPLAAMPPALRPQIRYPIDYFAIQAGMYARYHMTDPTVFYNDEDQWTDAQEVQGSVQSSLNPQAIPAAPTSASTAATLSATLGGTATPPPGFSTGTTPVLPYYVILKFPGMARAQFVLMQPFTPIGAGRDNMSAWMAAFSDGSNYGRVVAYEFPKEQTVFGPLQVDSQINQDPTVAQLLTLWSQGGSEVYRGNLLVIPIRHALLYVEPLYQAAASTDLPALRRVIVDYGGQRIAVGDTLDQALQQIFGPLPWVAGTSPAAGLSQRPLSPGQAPAVARVVQQATALYARAQGDLRQGDFSGYAQAITALGPLLDTLRRLVAAAPVAASHPLPPGNGDTPGH